MKIFKRIVIPLVLVLVAVFALFPNLLFGLFFSLISVFDGTGTLTETTDIADYGIISGNYDNDSPTEIIFSFFPEKISEDFSNVSYRYTAQKGDAYACQIWLEFDIEDKEEFDDFICTYTDSAQITAFRYDNSYLDYTVSNYFELTSPEDDEPGDIHIEYAQIGKVLYSEDTQHIIFYALCLYDGGFSSTKILGDFFTRFSIDPIEYEAAASSRFENH